MVLTIIQSAYDRPAGHHMVHDLHAPCAVSAASTRGVMQLLCNCTDIGIARRAQRAVVSDAVELVFWHICHE